MIRLLIPLGLLGLLSIAVLIFIYIIKPNYIVKHVSSNYVWKLALRYRRKRLPTSKIRNLLIFLCQIFILALATLILTMPVLAHEDETSRSEVVIVIDSSASMYAESADGVTRFERAVTAARQFSDSVLSSGGYVSVILADREPSFLARGISSSTRVMLIEQLDRLLQEEGGCSYSEADIQGAMTLCEEILTQNSSAGVYLYTDTIYTYAPKDVVIKNVALADPEAATGEWSGEWNAAILNAEAVLEDVYYELSVELACYGRAEDLTLDVQVVGANALNSSEKGETINFSRTVQCDMGTPIKLIFRYGGGTDTDTVFYFDLNEKERFFSFQSISLSIGGTVEDSFSVDNSFSIYGGQKELLKVQYASSLPNTFVTGVLQVLQNAYRDRWDMRVTDVKQGEEPAYEGYDFYIFEHKMPRTLPSDGVVFLLDPEGEVPMGSDLGYVGQSTFQRNGLALTATDSMHPVMQHIIADDITVSQHKVLRGGPEFETLMTCDGNPVLMVKKDEVDQIAVLAFSLHFSNLCETPDWFFLMYNLFEYYLPATVIQNSYEVGEAILLNARGPELTVSGPEDFPEPFREFPATFSPNIPGAYTLRHKTYFGKDALTTEIYVKIPAIESNICRTEDSLVGPNRALGIGAWNDDLLIYFAAAALLLLFIEWWLHSREGR